MGARGLSGVVSGIRCQRPPAARHQARSQPPSAAHGFGHVARILCVPSGVRAVRFSRAWRSCRPHFDVTLATVPLFYIHPRRAPSQTLGAEAHEIGGDEATGWSSLAETTGLTYAGWCAPSRFCHRSPSATAKLASACGLRGRVYGSSAVVMKGMGRHMTAGAEVRWRNTDRTSNQGFGP